MAKAAWRRQDTLGPEFPRWWISDLLDGARAEQAVWVRHDEADREESGGRNRWDNRGWNISGPGLPWRCPEAAASSGNAGNLQVRAVLLADPCGQPCIIRITGTGTASPAEGKIAGQAAGTICKDETLVCISHD